MSSPPSADVASAASADLCAKNSRSHDRSAMRHLRAAPSREPVMKSSPSGASGAIARHRTTLAGTPLAGRDVSSAAAVAASSATRASASRRAARLVSSTFAGRGTVSSLSESLAPGIAARTILPWKSTPRRSPVFASQDTTHVRDPAAYKRSPSPERATARTSSASLEHESSPEAPSPSPSAPGLFFFGGNSPPSDASNVDCSTSDGRLHCFTVPSREPV